jgi:branched-subunit amino acid aminotransferase/4-amino-4-deoxychorismate lyase
MEACEPALREAGDGFARIYLTAGDGPVTAGFDHCRVLILVEDREPPSARIYHRGYDLGIHAGGHAPLFAGLKTGNYWANLRSFREGVARQCNETLLFTPAGHLISACMANVFVVSGDTLKTPDLTTGARNGVVREWVMKHLPVTESLVTRAEVEAAGEIFLTSSWLGIIPAASIEGHTLPERKLGTRLLAEYRSRLNEV